MLNVLIIAVGNVRERFFLQAIETYLERLRPYAKVKIEEVKAEPFSASNKEKAKKIEADKILNLLSKYQKEQIWLLDEEGEEFDSLDFSQNFSDTNLWILVIAGALGFSEEILSLYPQKLSLSKLTFPHEMARMILLEQIYRAVTIKLGKKYHY